MNDNKVEDKADKLLKKINSNAQKNIVLLLGFKNCPFTLKSKNYLDTNNIKYKYYSIDKYRDILFDILNKIHDLDSSYNINLNHKTFPVIFIDNKFIGGFSELIKYSF